MTHIVESLTHLGMGRLSDGTLVPRVLPGEEVDVADGTVRVLTPSTDRVSPPCRHFKTCGGCAVQHASDTFIAGWKTNIVETALRNRGLETELAPIHTSPPQSRRRAKFAGRRTKKGAMVGFHARASDLLVEVPDCQLITPDLRATMPALQALTRIACSRKGEIALTFTQSDAGPDVMIEGDRALTDDLRVALADAAREIGLSRLSWGDEVVVMRHPPVQRFGPASVVPPPGAFLQATSDGEAALLDEVTRIVGGAGRIADLFAGCGTFALPLATQAEVHAVEGSADMIDALDRGWRAAQGLKRVTSEARDLFRRPLEPDEFARCDAVVLDPPRAGAEAQIRTLAQAKVPVIAMVSCNPVTFARDAATLTGSGFTLDRVQIVDQFRWSTHVELVGAFTRA